MSVNKARQEYDWEEVWSMSPEQLSLKLGEVKGGLVQKLADRRRCRIYQVIGGKAELRYQVLKQQHDYYGLIRGGDKPFALSSLERVGEALLIGRPEIERTIGRALLAKEPQAKVLQMPLRFPQREKIAA